MVTSVMSHFVLLARIEKKICAARFDRSCTLSCDKKSPSRAMAPGADERRARSISPNADASNRFASSALSRENFSPRSRRSTAQPARSTSHLNDRVMKYRRARDVTIVTLQIETNRPNRKENSRCGQSHGKRRGSRSTARPPLVGFWSQWEQIEVACNEC
jgi:hypothetical protein